MRPFWTVMTPAPVMNPPVARISLRSGPGSDNVADRPGPSTTEIAGAGAIHLRRWLPFVGDFQQLANAPGEGVDRNSGR